MPFAKGVSAKTGEFDAQGNAVDTDYLKMMKIVKSFGYTGYVGVESGAKTPEGEYESVRLTKALLEKVGAKLSQLFVIILNQSWLDIMLGQLEYFLTFIKILGQQYESYTFYFYRFFVPFL